MSLMILARSSSEAPALAVMASAFHLPMILPGAFFSFAMAIPLGMSLLGQE
jgi:hypothetical protein